MGNTHFSGAILASGAAGRGLFKNLPIELLGRIDYFLYFNDFVRGEGDYDDTADWTENNIGTPTSAAAGITTDTRHGVLLVDAGTAVDSGIQTEFTGASGAGEFCVPTDGKSFAFGARFKKNDANGGAMWVGLGETLGATPILVPTDGLLTNLTNGIGFWTGEASAALALVNKRASGGTGTLGMVTLSDDTYVEVAFRADVRTISSSTDCGYVTGYRKVDGVWQRVGTTSAVAIPNTGLCPQFAAKNEPGTSLNVDLSIDYIWYAEQR